MTSTRTAFVVGLLLPALGARLYAAPPARPMVCAAVANAEELLVPGATIVFGEAHGNEQSPHLIAALACAAARHGNVRVALELPADEEPPIEAFLKSSGDRAARSRLLAGRFWTRPYQDGRSSQAMVELLEALRQLRHDGTEVAVATFDETDRDRDRAMAERLLRRRRAEPQAIFLVLTGNVHARRVPQRPEQIPMVQRLVAAGMSPIALNGHYGVGTTWACTSDQSKDCGPIVWGRGDGRPSAIVRARSREGAYDGYFDAGVANFSPPAALPLTDTQRTRGRFAAIRAGAVSDYQHGNYRGCASTYSDLAVQDATLRAEDWYNAASCFGLANDSAHAFTALDRAVGAGMADVATLGSDPDIASLRSDPRWSPLVARARATHDEATPHSEAAP